MLRPTAISVTVQKDYTLKVIFNNGETKIFDVKPYIKGSWYSRLKDFSYFSLAKADGFTVIWPEGQDICPDELYYNSVPVQFQPIQYLPYHQKKGLATMDIFSKQIYEAGINDGKAEGKAESIKNLMSTMNVSIDQAMDILKTLPEERQYFKDLLAKEL